MTYRVGDHQEQEGLPRGKCFIDEIQKYDQKYISWKWYGGHFEFRQYTIFPEWAAGAPYGFVIRRFNLT